MQQLENPRSPASLPDCQPGARKRDSAEPWPADPGAKLLANKALSMQVPALCAWGGGWRLADSVAQTSLAKMQIFTMTCSLICIQTVTHPTWSRRHALAHFIGHELRM